MWWNGWYKAGDVSLVKWAVSHLGNAWEKKQFGHDIDTIKLDAKTQ